MNTRTIQSGGHAISLRRATLDEIVDLRHAVLRHGLPRESAIFPGDDETTARHYAATNGSQVICCATLHLTRWLDVPAWQLRGMATAEQFRGRGVGSELLRFVETDVAGSGVRQMWCNARTLAVAFYQRHGWAVASEPFDIPSAGPHVRMSKRITPVMRNA